jgi:arylsulfatase A-like enzyme
MHGFDYYFGIPYSNDMWTKRVVRDYPPLPLLRGNEVIDTIDSDDKQSLLCKQFTDEAISFIKDHRDDPFLLYLPHSFIHGPRIPRDSFLQATPNPDKKTGGVIAEVDLSVGRILTALEETGLEQNTLVWFISDNGGAGKTANIPLRGGKGSHWEGGFRIPSIVRWTGKIPAGKRLDGIMSAMDIYPTLASLAGKPALSKQVSDGLDMSELLLGKVGKSPREIFYYYVRDELSAIRYRNWKLNDAGELFNLNEDIGEENDVSNQHPEIIDSLNIYFEKARKELGDARLGLKGVNCRPPGKKINDLKFILPDIDENGNIVDYAVLERKD